MFAIIKTGGKQYKIKENDTIFVEKLKYKKGDKIDIKDVLLLSNDEKNIKIGTPILKGITIKAEVLNQKKNKKVIVLDPMLATGNSSIAAINLILNKGVGVNNIFLVSLLAAPEGLKNIQKTHKKLRIFTCQIDKKLNKKKLIVPGLGDAGDRYMGT